MPFREGLHSHLEVIARCGRRLGLEVRRVDTSNYSANIIQGISKALAAADLVVADLTNTNPNVMYELAIAQCLGKKVVLLTTDRSTVPFDLLTYRIELIDPALPDGVEQLCARMQAALDATYISGPLGGTIVFGQPLFIRRIASFLIDVIPLIMVFLLWYLSIAGIPPKRVESDILLPLLVVLEVSLALGFPLYVSATTATLGATLGQRALGLRVVTMDGDRPGFWRALGRAMSAIFLVGCTYGVGFLWCLRGPSFRAFHDIASQTMVVKRPGMAHSAST